MRKIEVKDVKVGDYFFIIDGGRNFMLKKVANGGKKSTYEWWRLTGNRNCFEIIGSKNSHSHLNDYTFDPYKIFKLNKTEIKRFEKLLIINNL